MNSAFRLAVRQFSTSRAALAGEVPAGTFRNLSVSLFQLLSFTGFGLLKTKQKMFNIDNGLRVHQRGGTFDSVIYNTTLALIVVGGAMWIKTVYTMAYPQK